MNSWLKRVREGRAAKAKARVPRVPVYDHTITRQVRNVITGKTTDTVESCRVTPKRISLASGEVYKRENGVRVLSRNALAWSSYRWKVDLETLKRKTVAKPPVPAKKPR